MLFKKLTYFRVHCQANCDDEMIYVPEVIHVVEHGRFCSRSVLCSLYNAITSNFQLLIQSSRRFSSVDAVSCFAFVHLDTIWLQQLNGSIFCFMPSTEVDNQQNNERVSEVPPPAEIAETIVSIAMAFTTMCAASDALWGLLPDGRLFVRAGMSAHCSTGVEWVQVNLPNIGKHAQI